MKVPTRLRRDRRPLMAKVRVVVTEPMPKAEVLKRVEETIQTGVLAEGIEIHYLDWAKGAGRHVNSGRVDGDLLAELQKFAGAFQKATPRVERAE